MKIKIFLLGVLLSFWTVAVWGGEKKSLVIMLDGMRSDVMFSASTPNIDSLIDGSWADGYRGTWTYQAHTNLDSPPSSATNHVAIATGVTATKNNVFNNGEIHQGKYDEFPSYLEILKKAQPELITAWLHNWTEDADIRTLANYQKLIKDLPGFEIDMKLVDEAVQILDGTFPTTEGISNTKWEKGWDIDCLMLYLDSMDMFGHGNGFSVFIEPYFEKMTTYDAQIGRLLDAIRRRPNFSTENWQIIVVSDHGGYKTTHGIVGCENCYTIPLVVSSKDVPSGRMKGQPQNCSVAAYVLEHMIGQIPEYFDGKTFDVHQDAEPNIQNGLIVYLPFENNFNDFCKNAKIEKSNLPIALIDGGINGKCAQFEKEGAFLSLGKPDILDINSTKGFSATLWFKANGNQKGDPVLLSNKDWASGKNPGFVLAANLNNEGTSATFNLSNGDIRDDLNPMDYPADQWMFFAITVDLTGNAAFYLGDQNGRLAFISDDISDEKELNALEWVIGNDGTKKYPCSLNGSVDELGIWNRELLLNEVNAVYQKGIQGIPLMK
ncbi:MAG: alkaline phosphatase family protein [Planctomycetia bacterium]|nr:alkaline phosphatase family protein [Planctomycetia bacterium]